MLTNYKTVCALMKLKKIIISLKGHMFTSTICHNKILNSADKETLQRCNFLNKKQKYEWDRRHRDLGIEWVGVAFQGELPEHCREKEERKKEHIKLYVNDHPTLPFTFTFLNMSYFAQILVNIYLHFNRFHYKSETVE